MSTSTTFVLGFIAGLLASIFIQTTISILFWLSIGIVTVLMLDLSLGIGRNACGLRSRIRDFVLRGWLRRAARPSGIVVPFTR